MRRASYHKVVSVVVPVVALVAMVLARPASFGGATGGSVLGEAISVARIRHHLAALDVIARENGGVRAAGTPGYQASVDYVREQLDAAGYRVTLQPFQVPFFTESAAPVLARVGPSAREHRLPLDIRTLVFSGSGDVTATVAPVHLALPPAFNPDTSTSGCRPSDFAGFSRGAIALIQRGDCPFLDKVLNAQDAGAAGVLIMNEGQIGRQDLVTGSLERPGLRIPVLGVTYALGVELAEPGTVVHLVTRTVSEYRQTTNVLADGPGGHSGKVVMVGAHLDSVSAGPGINDDGSGVAVVLEMAVQLAHHRSLDGDGVRFAFWGGEELGLLGSGHYVSGLGDDQRRAITAYLNFDMLGSPNYARLVYDGAGGPSGSAGIGRLFVDSLTSRGFSSELTPLDGRSDYAPFAYAGIPVGGLFSGAERMKTADQAARYGGSAGQPLDGCYHRACDTIDNISDDALEQLSGAAADVVEHLLTTSLRAAPH